MGKSYSRFLKKLVQALSLRQVMMCVTDAKSEHTHETAGDVSNYMFDRWLEHDLNTFPSQKH